MSDERIPNAADKVPNRSERFGTVKQAAEVYGLSERVILKRLSTGQIDGKKDSKVWRVLLLSSRIDDRQEIPRSEPVPNDSESKPLHSEHVPNALEALVEHQVGEIAFLRTEIERRNQAEGELRRLMLTDRQEIARLRDQLAITAAPTDVPEATTDTPGDQNGSESGPADDRGENSAQKRKTKWWHLWER